MEKHCYNCMFYEKADIKSPYSFNGYCHKEKAVSLTYSGCWCFGHEFGEYEPQITMEDYTHDSKRTV